MEYISLNNSINMPIIGFGTWDVRGKFGERIILNALECGYRLIDTAQMYKNEDIVGNAIVQSSIDRSEIFIITKLDLNSNSYHKAQAAIESSLNRLQSNYIDLVLIHEPYSQALQMYEALKDGLLKQKIRAIGVSNFSQQFYAKFIQYCGIIPAVNQVESHIYYPQFKLQEYLNKYGTKMQSWGPLTSKTYNLSTEPLLKHLAHKYACSEAMIALRYLTQNKIAIIPKSTSIEHMQQNLASLDFDIEDNDLKLLANLNTNKSLFNWYD